MPDLFQNKMAPHSNHLENRGKELTPRQEQHTSAHPRCQTARHTPEPIRTVGTARHHRLALAKYVFSRQ